MTSLTDDDQQDDHHSGGHRERGQGHDQGQANGGKAAASVATSDFELLQRTTDADQQPG